MKKLSVVIASFAALAAGASFAQNANDGITMSQDPAKAAAIEQHAAELKAHSQAAAKEETANKPARHHHARHHANVHGKTHTAPEAAAK